MLHGAVLPQAGAALLAERGRGSKEALPCEEGVSEDVSCAGIARLIGNVSRGTRGDLDG